MVSRKSKTIIGFFVLGAIALVCGLMIILGTMSFTKDASYFALYFNASLRGLTVGASVYFNGVHVGKVVSMEIASSENNTHFDTPVIIELNSPRGQMGNVADRELFDTMKDDIDVDELIAHGLRAKLSTSSFITGLLVVDLVMDPNAKPVDMKNYPSYRGFPQIPSIESGIDSLLYSFSKLPIHAMAEQTLTLISNINKTINDIKLTELSNNINNLLTNINNKLDPLLANANNTLESLDNALKTVSTSISSTSNTLTPSLKMLEETLINANIALQSITEMSDLANYFLDDKSATMQEFALTMEAIRQAATAISGFAEELEKKPNALIFGKR